MQEMQRPEGHADLVLHPATLLDAARLHVDVIDLFPVAKEPPARSERDEHHAIVKIHVGHQLGAFRCQHTHHLEGNPVDLEAAAKPIAVGEQDPPQLGADHGHASPSGLCISCIPMR
jgi:hypothetical protein